MAAVIIGRRDDVRQRGLRGNRTAKWSTVVCERTRPGGQRRQPYVPDDEPRLVAHMIDLAGEYGRYGYRRITAPSRLRCRW